MNSPVIGVALQSAVCVQIRWLWLLFPAALIILAAVLLVSVMVDSTLATSMRDADRENAFGAPFSATNEKTVSMARPPGVWKSSLLPLIYHGLQDRRVREEHPAILLPLKTMQERAEETKVKLTRTEGGWRFVKVD